MFPPEPILNLLPKDGTVNYYGKILVAKEADLLLQDLLQNIAWQNDEAIIFGKKIITKRMVAWYGSKPFSYTYSKSTKTALPFTESLLYLKNLAEQICQCTYNSCLINLYHNNTEGMAYHSDAEKMLAPNASIASISLGAERKFLFKHKNTKDTVTCFLHHGSLLEMKGNTQSHWMHRLPTTTKTCGPRVNLTFRTILE